MPTLKVYHPNILAMKKIIIAFLLICFFSQSALAAGYELHHVFPRSMSGYFNSIGIDPDLWCIPLKRQDHIGAKGQGIHTMRFVVTGGLNYNESWKVFAATNPHGPASACFAFASVLLSEYGIRGKINTYNYKTRGENGNKIEIGSRLGTKLINKARTLAPHLAKKALFLYLAYEAFRFACAADDIYPDEKLMQRAEEYFIQSIANYENDFEFASKQLAQAYFYLGTSVLVKQIEVKTDFYKETIDLFSKADSKRLGISLYCLSRSVSINQENPFAQLFYAEALYWDKEFSQSLAHAEIALASFQRINDKEMISAIWLKCFGYCIIITG